MWVVAWLVWLEAVCFSGLALGFHYLLSAVTAAWPLFPAPP